MKRNKINQTKHSLLVLFVAILAGLGQVTAQCSQWTTVADTFCTNDAAITLVGTPTPGVFFGPGVTGASFDPSTAGAGSHSIGYTANSCTDTSYIQMLVQLLPTITLNIPTSPVNQKNVCEFDGPYSISGNNPNPGWPTSWFTGNGVDTLLGTFDPDPTLVGWNTITFHYDDGVCSGTAVDSIEVMENPTATIDPAFPDQCITDPILTLTQGSGLPAGGAFTYTGNGVSGSQSTGFFFDPSVAGVGQHAITYCYTAPNGCETCVTQNITVYDVPTASFSSIQAELLCENAGPLDLTPYGTPLGGYFTGVGVQSDSITLKPGLMGGPGTYSLTYTYVDTTGCSDQFTQNVTVNPKPIITIVSNSPLPTPNPPTDDANILIKICEGDTAYTTVTSQPGGTFLNQDVQPLFDRTVGPSTINFYPLFDQLYEIYVTTGVGCVDTGTVTIDAIPPALAQIDGDPNLCIGDSVTLTASGATSYTWINPPTTGSVVIVSPKVSDTYQVVADSDVDGDGNKCSSDTAELYVAVRPLPLITTGKDTTLFYGDQTILRAYGGAAYFWSEGVEGELSCFPCNAPVATPIFDISEPPIRGYYVVGTDTNGCENGDSIYVSLNTRIVIFVPTAFTPNGDGFNDELFVETKGIESIELEIFDRFGKTVFETTKLNEGWNGQVDGNLISKDVYLYRLKAIPFEKTVPPIDQAGEITLIR